jgi:hypothetical protein
MSDSLFQTARLRPQRAAGAERLLSSRQPRLRRIIVLDLPFNQRNSSVNLGKVTVHDINQHETFTSQTLEEQQLFEGTDAINIHGAYALCGGAWASLRLPVELATLS